MKNVKIVILLLLVIGCSNQINLETDPIQNTSLQETAPKENLTIIPERKLDKGDFKIVYSGNTEEYSELQEALQQDLIFEEAINEINNRLSLPEDIQIVFTECEEINAYWYPEQKSIYICYELIEYNLMLFSELSETPEDAVSPAIYSIFFIMSHELGHALIDVLDLPVLGREEDAADQIATLFTLSGDSETEDPAIAGAIFFHQLGQQTKSKDLMFWDEHGLDKQRFYNILCLMYGSNPEKNRYLVDEGYLPEERAVTCSEEYSNVNESWDKLLQPFNKN